MLVITCLNGSCRETFGPELALYRRMQTFRYTKLILILFALSLVACGKDLKQNRGDSDEVFRQNYEYNIQLWQEASTNTAYYYSYTRTCYCLEEHVQFNVSVNESSEITSVQKIKSNGQLEAFAAEDFDQVVSIDELFATIKQKIDGEVSYVNVEYDQDLGYPKNIYVDFDFRMADDEKSYSIKKFSLKTQP